MFETVPIVYLRVHALRNSHRYVSGPGSARCLAEVPLTIVKRNSAHAAQNSLRACNDGRMSSFSRQVSAPDLRSWLLPTTEKVSYAGREIPTTELLADPYTALGIADHENDMWRTHARIELDSDTEATVIITMKGAGGTDRLRLALVQLP